MAHVSRATSSPLRFVLFTTLAACIVVVFVLATLSVSVLFYQSNEQHAEGLLDDKTSTLASQLTGKSTHDQREFVASQIDGTTRVTLIAHDGSVLFDSFAPADELENHANRPEVRSAFEVGYSQVARHSETTGIDLVYAAALVHDAAGDASVVRLAQERKSLWAYMGDIALPLAVLLVVAIVFAFGVARVLTRRVLAPINAIRVDDPLASETYAELTPLLRRIHDQQKRMSDQAHHMEIQHRDLMRAQNVRREFSANVSHEMKTPLTVIAGYAELLMNNLVKSEDQQRVAGLIYDESQHLRSLIDDVLIISRMEESAGQITDERGELIDLAQIVDGVCARLMAAAELKEIRIESKIAPALMWGMPVYCEQMVYNLLDNALRYSPAGRTVYVSCGVWTQDEACESGIKRPAERHLDHARVVESRANPAESTKGFADMTKSASWLLHPAESAYLTDEDRVLSANETYPVSGAEVFVQVSDEGEGIDPAFHDKVFERFYRVDESHSKTTGGTGLGLAIVKHAVHAQGGTILLESEVNQGSTFTLIFPEADVHEGFVLDGLSTSV